MIRPSNRIKRTVLTVLAVVTGLLITATLVTASVWPVINVVETGKTGAYPDVLPQYFSADPKRLYDETERALIQLDGWKIDVPNPDARRVEATHTSLFGEQAVSIEVLAETEFVSRIHIRSESVGAKGDFGQNARNIRELQAELDRRLGAVRFDPYAVAADSP